MKQAFLFLMVVMTFAATSCKNSKWNIDTSPIKIEQKLYRFDNELFSMNMDSVWENVPDFELKYGVYFDLYNSAIINIGGTNQLDYNQKLAYFITDPYIAEAYSNVKELFNDNGFYAEIHEAFKRFNYYFPEKNIPNIITQISGFNQSLVVDSSFIAISLDKYLGVDSKFYTMLRTPIYLRQNMHPAKIPSDVMFAWTLTEFPYHPETDNLANQMIYYGKLQYILDALLPNTPDSLRWGFTQQKLNWCADNERLMWLYLVENKLLFSSQYKDIKRFIDDGPFTTPFSKESPARSGQWVGYQIVNSYMKHNSQITLGELMAQKDYQKILNESRYKP